MPFLKYVFIPFKSYPTISGQTLCDIEKTRPVNSLFWKTYEPRKTAKTNIVRLRSAWIQTSLRIRILSVENLIPLKLVLGDVRFVALFYYSTCTDCNVREILLL
jgi:hypothetical protein